MLTLESFRRQSAQEYGKDSMDAIDSEDSVYLVPEQPIDDLPELRIRIWPHIAAGGNNVAWTWNWRAAHLGPKVVAQGDEDGPEIRMKFVDGKTEYDTMHSCIAEAAEAAISSINDYLKDEMQAEQRLEKQRTLAERDKQDRIDKQLNDFLNR